MANFNKVILAGNLTRDPELAHTASNMPICKFGLAINRKWRDKNTGENREDTCFVDCAAFGRGGEVIKQYMTKGQSILVEGRLNYSKWDAQDGSKRSKLDVVVENFTFLGTGGGGGGGGGGRSGAHGQGGAQGQPGGGYSQGGGYDQGGYDQGGGYNQGGGRAAPAGQRPASPAPPPQDGPPPMDDYGPPMDDDNVPF